MDETFVTCRWKRPTYPLGELKECGERFSSDAAFEFKLHLGHHVDDFYLTSPPQIDSSSNVRHQPLPSELFHHHNHHPYYKANPFALPNSQTFRHHHSNSSFLTQSLTPRQFPNLENQQAPEITSNSLEPGNRRWGWFCQWTGCTTAKEFSKKANLKSHVTGTHNPFPLFICQICGDKFKRKQDYMAHFRSKHPDEKIDKRLRDLKQSSLSSMFPNPFPAVLSSSSSSLFTSSSEENTLSDMSSLNEDAFANYPLFPILDNAVPTFISNNDSLSPANLRKRTKSLPGYDNRGRFLPYQRPPDLSKKSRSHFDPSAAISPAIATSTTSVSVPLSNSLAGLPGPISGSSATDEVFNFEINKPAESHWRCSLDQDEGFLEKDQM